MQNHDQRISPGSAQKELGRVAGGLRTLRDHLQNIHTQLGEEPGENDMAEGRRPWSFAFSIRGTIECVIQDDLDPAIRSLEETVREGGPARAEVTIRQAQASDLDAVYRLGLTLPELQPSSAAPFLDLEELPQLLADGLLLVATTGDELIGFLYAERYHRLSYIAFLAVAPDYRRRGIATDLLASCSAYHSAAGATRLGGFACTDGEVTPFLARQGFIKGKAFTWRDRPI